MATLQEIVQRYLDAEKTMEECQSQLCESAETVLFPVLKRLGISVKDRHLIQWSNDGGWMELGLSGPAGYSSHAFSMTIFTAADPIKAADEHVEKVREIERKQAEKKRQAKMEKIRNLQEQIDKLSSDIGTME